MIMMFIIIAIGAAIQTAQTAQEVMKVLKYV
jgi:hypothetical protein